VLVTGVQTCALPISLIEYCLRALGEPVLEVNVDEDQVSDRIDEALQFYQEYHSDAIVRMFHKHQLTQTDIDNQYITLPDAITVVQSIFPLQDENSSINMFDAKYQLMLNDMYNLGFTGNLSNYVQIQEYIRTIDIVLNGEPQVRFNRHMNRLYIDMDWSIINEGDYIIAEAYQIVDPTVYADVWKDRWLLRYAACLIKQQWGTNLKKFQGMQMPGGLTFNGQQIYDEATQERQQLESEMIFSYSLPATDMIG
jgi:hypothetical protein